MTLVYYIITTLEDLVYQLFSMAVRIGCLLESVSHKILPSLILITIIDLDQNVGYDNNNPASQSQVLFFGSLIWRLRQSVTLFSF